MSKYTLCGDPSRRHDFLLVFDVQDGNPNGDPDAGNMPRIDPETAQGLVTDVCLKRKVRNFVTLAKPGEPGFDIFIQDKGVLNRQIEQAYGEIGVDLTKVPTDEKDGKKRNSAGTGQGGEIPRARKRLCETKYDVRMFGAVMSTGPNAGQVRGPAQLTFARSIDSIAALDISITRMAVATEAEAEKQGGDNRTIGRKTILPYGLYIAAQTGVSRNDLELFWEALELMFDQDHSAARGHMSCRGLYVFTHERPVGNAPSHVLFEKLTIPKVGTPRQFSDYAVSLDETMPAGVTLTRLVG
jgi:CRISPR-associated protein Csd2